MGHLNSFSASGGGNLNKHFPKIQMPGGLPRGVARGLPGGMFKLRFDWYITELKLLTLTYVCDVSQALVEDRRRHQQSHS